MRSSADCFQSADIPSLDEHAVREDPNPAPGETVEMDWPSIKKPCLVITPSEAWLADGTVSEEDILTSAAVRADRIRTAKFWSKCISVRKSVVVASRARPRPDPRRRNEPILCQSPRGGGGGERYEATAWHALHAPAPMSSDILKEE